MDINQSGLSRFKSNKIGISRSTSETKALTESSRQKENSKPLELKEGQFVKGQIIDHRYNEVSIQLEPSKQVVTAKLSGDVPLAIGQEAQFQVTEDSADHLVLKYIPNETSVPSDATIQKALTASGLPLTERNKTIVSELLNHTLPIDKQTLQTLIKLSNTNREVSPLSLILMYKNKIPMTTANIKQFEAYQNGTHQLLNDIRTITKNLAELLQSPEANLIHTDSSESKIASEVSLLQKVIPQETADPLIKATKERAVSPTNQSNQNMKFLDIVQTNGKLLDILYNNSGSSSITNTADSPLHHYLVPEDLTLLNKTLEQELTNNSSLASAIPTERIEQLRNGTLSLESAVKVVAQLYPQDRELPEVVSTLLEKYSQVQEDPAKLSAVLTSTERTALLNLIGTLPINENFKSQILEGTVSLNDTLTFLQQHLAQMEEKTARQLLQSPEYFKLLEGAFQQKWTITPDQLAKKTSVSDLYQNLQEDLENLNTLLKTNSGSIETQNLQAPVKNLQENLHFMKDLNEMFTYLQLPVQLKVQDVHSDFYVFTNKKALIGQQETLSVLLHLDMTNLGALNIHLQMNRNNLQAKFYLANSNVEQLITENLPSLSESLLKKGYQLHSEVMSTYEKPDFSKDFIEQNSADHYVQRYTFDIRT